MSWRLYQLGLQKTWTNLDAMDNKARLTLCLSSVPFLDIVSGIDW